MSAPMPIRVALIDDHAHIHELVTLALASQEDIQLVGRGMDGKEAILLCQSLMPDMVLMDVVMPKMDGVEATRHIRELFPQIKIVVLSSYHDDDSVRTMMDAGAVGYLLKSAIAQDLASMVRSIYRGSSVFSREVADKFLVGSSPAEKHDFGLTERELEVLRLMSQGLNHAEVAAQLVISQSTVKFHLTNILEKMGVSTRAEAIVLAAKNDLV